MCLGVPGRIVLIDGPRELAMATVDVRGTRRATCLSYLPDAKVGDWVLMHCGFAVALLDDASAQQSLALFDELGTFEPTTTGAGNVRNTEGDAHIHRG